MLKKTLIILSIIGFLTPVTLLAGTVHFGNEYSLRKNEEIKDDLYVTGNNTTIAGNVLGDLFAIGLNVTTSNNTITEDAFVIGGTATVLSDVKKDVRIFGGKTFFGGIAGEDLVVAAQEIQTLPQSVVKGSFLAAAGKVVVNGQVNGNVEIAGGEVFLNERVDGNVIIAANRVVIGPHAYIGGSFSYSSGNQAEIQSGATIVGETTFRAINTRPSAEKFLPTLWGTWVLVHFIVILISGLILHGVFKTISHKFVTTSIHHFGWSLIRGFVFVVAVPIAIALVFLTFVGIPFGFLGISLYTIFIILASVYGPIIFGSVVYRLVKREEQITINWKTILAGAILAVGLSYVPYLGVIIKFGLVLTALGGIFQVLFDKFVEVR